MSNRKFHFGSGGGTGRKDATTNASRKTSGNAATGAPGSAPNLLTSFSAGSSKQITPTMNTFAYRRVGSAPFATPSVPRGRPLSDQETYGANRPTTPARQSNTPSFRMARGEDGSSNFAFRERGETEDAGRMPSPIDRDSQESGGDCSRLNEQYIHSRSQSQSDGEDENGEAHGRSSDESYLDSDHNSEGERFNMKHALTPISDAYARKVSDVKKYKRKLNMHLARNDVLEDRVRNLENSIVETKEAMERCENDKNDTLEKLSAQNVEYLSTLDNVSTLVKRASAIGMRRRLEARAFNNILLQRQEDVSKHAARVQQKEEELSYLQGKLLDEVEAKQSLEGECRMMKKEVDDLKLANQQAIQESEKEKDSLKSQNSNVQEQLKDAKQSLEIEKENTRATSSLLEALEAKITEHETRTVTLQENLEVKSREQEALKKEIELLKGDNRQRNHDYEEEIRQINETKNCLQLRLLEETQSKDQLRSDLTLENKELQKRITEVQAHGDKAQASFNQEIREKDNERNLLDSELQKTREEASQNLQAKNKEIRGLQEKLKKHQEEANRHESEMKSLESQAKEAVQDGKLTDQKLRDEIANSGKLRSLVQTTSRDLDTLKTILAETRQKIDPVFEQIRKERGHVDVHFPKKATAPGLPETEEEDFKVILAYVQEGIQALVDENHRVKKDRDAQELASKEGVRVAHQQVLERLAVQKSLEEAQEKVTQLNADKRRLEEQLDNGRNNKKTLIERLQKDKRLVETAFEKLDVSLPATELKKVALSKKSVHGKEVEAFQRPLSPAPLDGDGLLHNQKPRKRLRKQSPSKQGKDTGGSSKRQKQPSLIRRKKRRSVLTSASPKSKRQLDVGDEEDIFDDDQKMSKP